MTFNCEEIKKLLENTPENLKDIVLLKKVSIAKGYEDIEDIEKEIDKLINKTDSRNLKKYLEGVKAINHNAFLVYQKSMAAQSGVIDSILKARSKQIINSIKTKEDLERIIQNQRKFIDNMNNIYTLIKDYKIDIKKTQLKSYINNILLAKLYNPTKSRILTDDFKQFILNKINENEIWKGDTKLYNNIVRYIDNIIRDVDAKILHFTEGDKFILSDRNKITDKVFKDFMKNKDKYIKLIESYEVLGKLKAISNIQAFNKTYDSLKTEIEALLEGTNKNTQELLSTLDKQQAILNKLISKGKIVNNIKILDVINKNKIQDKLGKLSFKITGFDISIPLTEQKETFERLLRDYVGDNNIKVSLLDAQSGIPIFKVEGKNYVEYVPVKDFKNIGDVFYHIKKLNTEEAVEAGVNSFEHGLELESFPYKPSLRKDQLYDTVYGIMKYVDGHDNEVVKEFINQYSNVNIPYFGSKIVDFIEGFLMNIELIEERNPFLAKILKRHGIILEYTTKGAGVKQLKRVLSVYNDNKKFFEDNLGSILLGKYVDFNKISKSELNNIFKNYNTSDIINILKTKGALQAGVQGYTIERVINEFENAKTLNTGGAIIAYVLKNIDYFKKTDIIPFDIIKSLESKIEHYIKHIYNVYKNTYGDILEGLKLNVQDIILDKIKNNLYKNNNIVGFNIKAGNTYELVDDIFREAEIYRNNGFLKTELANLGLSEKKLQSIYNGLLGKSVYGPGFLPQLVKKTKRGVLTVLLSHFSPKGWLLAGYNIVSGGIKAITAFNTNEKLYKEYIDLLKTLKSVDPNYYRRIIKDIVDNSVAEDILSAETVKYVDDERNVYEILAKKAIDYGNKVIDNINSKFKKGIPEINISEQKLGAILSGPMGLADKAVEKYFGIIPKVISESMQELGINMNELKKIVEEIKRIKGIDNKMQIALREGDKEAYLKYKNEYQKLLDEGQIDRLGALKNKLTQYLISIKSEATYKYQQFYKTATQLGLARNTLSDLWYINFFSSWGSKTAASFIFGTVGKAYKEAMLAAKFQPKGFRIGTFLKVFTDTLLTSPEFNAFIRQLGYASKIVYELNKIDNNQGNIDKADAIIQSTIAYQGFASDVITRSVMNMLETFKTAREQGESISQSAVYGILKGVLSASSNALKELKYAYGPLINGLYQQLKDKGEINSIDDIVHNYFDMYTSTYQSLLIANLGYYLQDQYAGITYERPDAWQGYNVLEAVLGIELTNYSNKMQKLKDYAYISKILDKPEEAVKGIINNILGYYYGYGQQYKLDEFVNVLNQDKTFLDLRDRGDVSNLNDEIIVKSFNSMQKSRLLSGWSLDKDISGDYQANLQLLFNELKQKGYNIDDLIKYVEYGYIRGDAKRLAQLQALGLTKAGQAVLLAEYARQKYKLLEKQYKLQYNISKVPEDIKNELKKEVLIEISPILATLDTTYHMALLDNYIKYTYKDNPIIKYYGSLSEKGGLKKTKAGEYLTRQLIAELADAADIEWDTTLFNNMSAALFKDIKGEHKIEAMANFFDEIDNFNFIGDKGKNVLKAGILYANRKDIKKILSSPYADKFQGAANKLADILWNYAQEIKSTPNILNALYGTGRNRHKVKISHLTNNKPYESIGQKVYNAIQQLANDIVKLPQFKHIPLNTIERKIDIALQKLGKVELPEEKLPSMKDLKEQIQSLYTKTLKTHELKVKKTKPQYKKIKQPKVKPVNSISSKKSRR